MIGRLSIFFVLLCWVSTLLGQEAYHAPIEKLKKELIYLQDTARINCLIKISQLYTDSDLYSDYDSVPVYALPAIEESRKLNYGIGLSRALYCLGNNYTRSDLAMGEKYLKEMISLPYHDDLVARARVVLGQCLVYQAKYTEASLAIPVSIDYFKKRDQPRNVVFAMDGLTICYVENGEFEKAFNIATECLKSSYAIRDTFYIRTSCLRLAHLYLNVGDFETSANYVREAAKYLPPDSLRRQFPTRLYYINLGELYLAQKNYDSALYCFQTAAGGFPTAVTYKARSARVYIAQKRFREAVPLLQTVIDISGKRNVVTDVMLGSLNLGAAYLGLKEYYLALQYANRVMGIAKDKNARVYLQDSYKLLYAIYDSLNSPGEALGFYKKYITIKDALISDQFKGRLVDFKRNAEDEKQLAQIRFLQQDKIINKQKLDKNRALRNVLIGSLLFLAFLSLIIVRNITLKRKNERLLNEKIKNEFEHTSIDLEMQALRAQMNPHFIFNCLSSINRFILKNESEAASDYLTRFSRLIRLVLINSQKSLISLEDEIEMLRLYLDMERLRFKNSFDYNIIYTNKVDAGSIQIPPLLLQPFCENAIWHGLMHKNEQGKLDIALSMEDHFLNCIITDNGIGRQKAEEIKKTSEEKKSLGLKITAERLALFNQDQKAKTTYEIEDMEDEHGHATGTRVRLQVGCKDHVSEIK